MTSNQNFIFSNLELWSYSSAKRKICTSYSYHVNLYITKKILLTHQAIFRGVEFRSFRLEDLLQIAEAYIIQQKHSGLFVQNVKDMFDWTNVK